MKAIFIPVLLISLATGLPFATGCSKHTTQDLAPEKVPAAMNQAFVQASGESKELAQDVATACQSQNTATAFTDLQKLSHRADLTPEQRSTTSQAMVGVLSKLRTESDQGNPSAQAVLQQYLSTR